MGGNDAGDSQRRRMKVCSLSRGGYRAWKKASKESSRGLERQPFFEGTAGSLR